MAQPGGKQAVVKIGIRDLRGGEDSEFFVAIDSVPNDASIREMLEIEVRSRFPEVKFKTYKRGIASFLRTDQLIVAVFNSNPSAELLKVAEPSTVIVRHGVQNTLFGGTES